MINRSQGEEWERVPERHCAQDIDNALALRP
ncbi:hypothetical protein VAE151_630104 [Vibrio aestuarianus]|nr:hypothetical protein VAE055_420104 [Vibrio aestuarianus]CAH8220328.1 hypothetical protein VAE032_320105 [Vibrio aestuarianus]CAH8220425.1 hypothetical protein VAE128_500100 [Vibrio aestuarianus]CAH8220687.1 hypothetical protein VAE130_600104 [Vibrio aestuarianus]CAH8220754.1 hypothetical protein VAE115_370102 [Vibrio aestuarianus]